MKPRLSLKGRGLKILAQREHSRSELRRKLLVHARAAQAGDGAAALADDVVDPAGEVEAVLDWLQAHHYLSEARFVESRVHVRAARYGNLRIRRELAQHGVVLDAGAAQQLKDSELSRAREVWSRKFGQAPNDAAERARQMRFLAARGFSGETIRRVVQGADDDGMA
ncbi:MAG: recombination regulator RecX [Rhizobacter sp.]|nr:recombination regulator RecX [Rhizobacter sp.]